MLIVAVILFITVFMVLLTPFNLFDNSGYSQIVPSNSNVSLVGNNHLPIKTELQNTSLEQLVPKEEKIEGNNSISNSTSNITALNHLSSTANSSSTAEMSPQVKITSHTKNQKVPVGTLTINGISSDNPSKICDVYVILNSIKPYQKVIPHGQNGQNNSTKDYSTWKFTFLPTYALISEGDNKMTAKIDCIKGAANSTKFNSLNVTGVYSNITTGNLLISKKSVPLVAKNSTVSNGVSPVDNTTSSPLTANPHSEQQLTEVPYKTDGITPNPTYLGITPASPLSNEVSPQNSSVLPSQHDSNLPSIEGQFADTKQVDPVDRERSLQTKKIVDKFIDKVQDTVEKRLEELINTSTPFKLVTPNPFETKDK
jgi:hypothetical protein